jgi:hypothetical protein
MAAIPPRTNLSPPVNGSLPIAKVQFVSWEVVRLAHCYSTQQNRPNRRPNNRI